MPNIPPPTGKLPEFLKLVDQVEVARGNQKKTVQRELEQFISYCTEAERLELKQHFESLITHDETVESARRVYRSRFRKVFNAVQETVGAVSMPIARLSQKTLQLVGTTLGLSAYGLWRAGVTTVNTFRNAA